MLSLSLASIRVLLWWRAVLSGRIGASSEGEAVCVGS